MSIKTSITCFKTSVSNLGLLGTQPTLNLLPILTLIPALTPTLELSYKELGSKVNFGVETWDQLPVHQGTSRHSNVKYGSCNTLVAEPTLTLILTVTLTLT